MHRKRRFNIFWLLSGIIGIVVLAQIPSIRNVVINPKTGVKLGQSGGWIYIQAPAAKEWTKLIPGTCPQWFPDGRRFIFFLPTGYSVDSQLWSADENGETRYMLTRSDYLIRESPIISNDSKEIAFHYSTCVASGSFEDIIVIDLREMKYPNMTCDAKVVLRAKPYTLIKSLQWVGEHQLSAVVGGKEVLINTKVKGMTPRS